MKKSMILGAAALATVAFAPMQADAGEVKIGGYYMFSMVNSDNILATDAANQDDLNAMYHRLQLNMDFIASPKSHAHMAVRVIDGGLVQGADTQAGSITTAATATADIWEIRQLWLETEMWGVGLKVGQMPIALNDNILVNHDTTSYGTLMLSKTFGDTTLVGANVRVSEGNVGGDGGATGVGLADGANEDDVDLYVLSLLGKAGKVNYQITGAYLDYAADAIVLDGLLDAANPNQDSNNYWLAGTIDTEVGNVNVTGTLIYEGGFDNTDTTALAAASDLQAGEGDFLAAVRMNGKTGFGGWNAYAFYAGEDYTAIPGVNDQAGWSQTWDQGGVGAQDLLSIWATGTNNNPGTAGVSGINTSMTENMWGIGAGLKVKAGAWTINPSLDYASLVEDTNAAGVQVDSSSAWGASVSASTKIQEGTTLGLNAGYIDPDDDTTVARNGSVDSMHFLRAYVKAAF